jgi:hypothetical protein
MIGKYRMIKRTNPINPGVVIPALSVLLALIQHQCVSAAYLSGRVFFILKKVGKIELRMSTKACPPKYICVPFTEN